MRKLRETETDKIAYELHNKHFPKELAQDYSNYGFATAMNYVINTLDWASKQNLKEINMEFIKGSFMEIVNNEPGIKEMFERLQKDNSN